MELDTTDIARALEISGWMEPDELSWLALMTRASGTVVEVGAWRGRTTRALADHCPGMVFVVDNWCDASEPQDERTGELVAHGAEAIEAEWRANLANEIASGKVTLVRGHSPEVAPVVQLASAGGVDFAFVDADHSFEGCVNDLAAYRAIVKPGGILAGHDYTTAAHPGVRKAVDLCFGSDVHQGPRSIWWVRL